MNTKRYIGAIDQGTSSTRFILFDDNGHVISSHQTEFKQHHPKSGESWVEHDPMEIMETVNTCITQTLLKAQLTKDNVVAVGVTNQRETTVVWDRLTGKPLHNAIVWLDTRTTSICEDLITRTKSIDHFRKVTGLPISPYFSAYKLRWLLDNDEQVRHACEQHRCMFGTIDSWIIYNLTGGVNGGVHVTDVTNASRTNLMNIHNCQWSHDVCRELSIPIEILPKIISSSEISGYITIQHLIGVPIAAALGDQQAAMVGQLCFDVGHVKNTYGTGCFMLMNTGNKMIESKNGLLTTVCYQLGRDSPIIYALEGSVAVAGAAIKWMRDQLQLVKSASEAEAIARSVPDSAGMYFVPAFSGLYAPHWRMDARGVFCGLTIEHGRAHFVRSALEAVCYRSREVIEAMTADSGVALTSLKVDGGMASNDLVVQFQADLLAIDVERPALLETTALGVAIAAGLATGYWASQEQVKQKLSSRYTAFYPLLSPTLREEKIKGWNKAVQRALNWVEHDQTRSKL